MLNRRKLLTIGGLAVGGVAGGGLLLPQSQASPSVSEANRNRHAGHHGGTGAVHSGRAPRITPFSVQMPVPPVLNPVDTRNGVDVYRLAIQPANVEILPGLRSPALTYGGQFVGPTIRARTGRPVRIVYGNRLNEPANVHLHGAHVAASSDGHPMDLIEPGRARPYDYPNTQQGATLWYHDHVHGLEAEHVYRGLHGLYLIDDPSEKPLGLPEGLYDVPIVLRDAHLDEKGVLVFSMFSEPGARSTILANGRPQPYFPVAARKYRFRLLNSANERVFRLSLGGVELTQIASDGGLLPAPVPRTELLIGSAERMEVVVDFSRYPIGTQLVLTDAETGPVLRFDVVRHAQDDSRVPAQLRPLPVLPPATTVRDVDLSFDLSGEMPVGLVNGKAFNPDHVDFTVKRGATEIWRVINGDGAIGAPHTFHMHLVQFQVLDRGDKPLWPSDVGRKDTVQVPPGESVRVKATFSRDFVGRYVYHCHFLEHSALGMMAQLEVVS